MLKTLWYKFKTFFFSKKEENSHYLLCVSFFFYIYLGRSSCVTE